MSCFHVCKQRRKRPKLDRKSKAVLCALFGVTALLAGCHKQEKHEEPLGGLYMAVKPPVSEGERLYG